MSADTLPPLELTLQFGSGVADVHRSLLTRARIVPWIRMGLAAPGEITVRVVGTAEGRRLNHAYRSRDYATNVLTFDYSHRPVVHADLVLCAPVVAREAREQSKSLKEHYAHLVVHGILHAQGYEHETHERDALEMETLESLLLQTLGYSDPYA